MTSVSAEETLERAVRHVSDGWLPPQEEVLTKVKSRLDSGTYNNDRRALHEDLKEDFALYMYCLRELTGRLKKRDVDDRSAAPLKLSPTQIFEASSLEAFREVLQRSHKDISPHVISEMNEYQATRFRETMLSAATAEVLSTKANVDPNSGFCCSLLRQLGLTLIAWNYPRVYSRAVETLTPESSLDLNLKKVLGFSPTLLGLTFARRWNLSDDILAGMGERKTGIGVPGLGAAARRTDPSKTADTTGQNGDVGAALAKICEVGEALARANHPEHYPTALHDWENAREAIAARLGPEGISAIYERAQTHLAEYAKHVPQLQDFTDSAAIKEHIVDSQYTTRLLERNQYVRSLPETLRSEFKKLYGRFRPNKILKSNIETLMKELIPQAGFEKGAVFMFDPERRHLAPAIKLGDVLRERLRPVRVSTQLAQFDLVASAYSLKTPLREERVDGEGHRVTVMAAAIGSITPVGVLYLETSNPPGEAADVDALQIFRAIRQCLCDCLNVG